MAKVNKKDKLGESLQNQINNLKKSISGLEVNLEDLKKDKVWSGPNANVTIKKIDKQLVNYRELLSKIEEFYSDNFTDTILRSIKF